MSFQVRVGVFSPDGSRWVRSDGEKVIDDISDAAQLGQMVAKQLLQQGAAELLSTHE
jgi:porphobilinogen deaminase